MNKNIVSFLRETSLWIFPAVLPLLLLCLVIGCDDVNSKHQKYYDRGEDIYLGVVDSLKGTSGLEKVRFDWEINSDPRITKTVIYWHQREDSVVVDVNRTQSGALPMTYTLENINEGDYVFEFITRDNEGYYSLPREAIVSVYGESYIQSLRNRMIESIAKQPDGSMLITWGDIASNDIQYATVEYVVNNETKFARVENDEYETILTGIQTGEIISTFTTYQPENALEPMDSPKREYTLPTFEREINKANFAMVLLTGDNISTQSGSDRDLSKIWDGQTANPGILHTQDGDSRFSFPHYFTFDMGVSADISRFRLWPRTDAGAFTGHSPRFFEIWGTNELKKAEDDEAYWTSDDWKADWKMLGDHEIIKPGSEGEQKSVWAAGWEYPVEIDSRVRYIRLVVKEENWQGSNCVNIGEITLWGDDL